MPRSSLYHARAAETSPAQKLMVASPRNIDAPLVGATHDSGISDISPAAVPPCPRWRRRRHRAPPDESCVRYRARLAARPRALAWPVPVGVAARAVPALRSAIPRGSTPPTAVGRETGSGGVL